MKTQEDLDKINCLRLFFESDELVQDQTVINFALAAEELEAWYICIDTYLAFWLWYESLPKSQRRVNYELSLADVLDGY